MATWPQCPKAECRSVEVAVDRGDGAKFRCMRCNAQFVWPPPKEEPKA